MACGGNFYKVKFRLKHLIYKELLSADMFEDLRVFGVQSAIAQEMTEDRAKTVFYGQYKHDAEILTIVPEKRIEQSMDVEVKIAYRLT